MRDPPLDKVLDSMSSCTVAICDGDRFIGSGVIVSAAGLVATCEHVVRDVGQISVCAGTRRIPAEIHSQFKDKDLAILRLDTFTGGKYARPGKVGVPRPGRRVFVLGYPLKDISSGGGFGPAALSEGIISKVYRDASGGVDFIQIDASIAPGYSGGPVFDESGLLFGIVTTKLHDGMACYIPAESLRALLPPLFEMTQSSIQFLEYAKREKNRYWDWRILDHYVALRCATKDGANQDLVRYALDVWLPDDTKPLLAILGEFGSGKTLSCHKLASQLLGSYGPGLRLPFIVKLGDMKEYGYESVKAMLTDQVCTRLGLRTLSWPDLEGLLRSKLLLLLFDGFEEMSMKAGRFQMADNFREILSALVPGSKAIVTCRTHYFGTEEEERVLFKRRRLDEIESLIMEESDPASVSIVHLEAFNDQDIQSYLEQRLGDWQPIYDKIHDPALYDLADLAKRPIFLDVIVETVPDLGFVGERLTGTRLYGLYAEMSFNREAPRLLMTRQVQSRFMEELAFEAYRQRSLYLAKSLMETVWSKLDHSDPKPDIELVMRRFPFLRRRERENELEFIHQSYFEFFVASRIARSIHERYHTLYADEYLTSPIDKYLIELLDNKDDIGVLEAWLNRHPEVNVRMNCALTLGRSRQGRYVPFLRQCLEKEGDIGVAGRIADALASLGDEGSQTGFLQDLNRYSSTIGDTGKTDSHRLLYDIVGPLEGMGSSVIRSLVSDLEHPNARIRKYAAFTLGRTRSPEAVPGLVTLLENPSETVRARRYAAAALGIIGSPSALPTLEGVAINSPNADLRLECRNGIERITEKEKPPSTTA